MPERRIILKSARELALMRQADRIVADTLLLLTDNARPGVTTRELDDLATEHVRRRGAVPSFPLVTNARGVPFSGTICISVNNEIVHGMRSKRVLRSGDIVSLDLGVIYQGWHGDAAITAPVGAISPEAQHLLDVTARALALAIAQVRPGAHLYDVSGAVEDYVHAERMGLVRQYVGHGIGRDMHEEPQVPNYRPEKGGRGPVLRPGMVLAIEPMVNLGRADTMDLDDGWTVVTKDGSLSAHFEHSVAVTAQGYEILSRPSDLARMWGDPAAYGLVRRENLEKLG
jgi:methionyl aminopeptidase